MADMPPAPGSGGWLVTFATDAGEFTATFTPEAYADPRGAALAYARFPSVAGRPLLWLKVEPIKVRRD